MGEKVRFQLPLRSSFGTKQHNGNVKHSAGPPMTGLCSTSPMRTWFNSHTAWFTVLLSTPRSRIYKFSLKNVQEKFDKSSITQPCVAKLCMLKFDIMVRYGSRRPQNCYDSLPAKSKMAGGAKLEIVITQPPIVRYC